MATFLTAEWRHLAMLNYPVDPDALRMHIPDGTELDLWNGTAYLSVVGFMFREVKVLGLPIPFHRTFEEVNLRFYVRRRDDDGAWRRGVVFIREIVPRMAVALVANVIYGENYVARPMRHTIEPGHVSYGWRNGGRWNGIDLRTIGEPEQIAPGSEEEFITEHYWGYSRGRAGLTFEYQVQHPRWRVWRVSQATLDCDVASVYGREFVPYLSGKPHSAFVADGSEISVLKGGRVS